MSDKTYKAGMDHALEGGWEAGGLLGLNNLFSSKEDVADREAGFRDGLLARAIRDAQKDDD